TAEAEALLEGRSISHNHILFRVYAMQAYLDAGDYEEVERHARALADYCPEEGLALVEFYADRGRALARAGQGERSAALAAELDRLIAESERLRELIALDDLRRARAGQDGKR
ncbi:MAG TPA: hypothetical protein VLL72_06625, partial [Kiloniellales bacterium]|nr:hypothetical protein [Kiloniellales bacterium]